jgi:hypothetical protein
MSTETALTLLVLALLAPVAWGLISFALWLERHWL